MSLGTRDGGAKVLPDGEDPSGKPYAYVVRCLCGFKSSPKPYRSHAERTLARHNRMHQRRARAAVLGIRYYPGVPLPKEEG